MKKTDMAKVMVAAALAVVPMLGGCSKEHRCKCVTTNVADDGLLKYFVVEGSIGCDDIKEMSYEVHGIDVALEEEEVLEVDCRDYGE